MAIGTTNWQLTIGMMWCHCALWQDICQLRLKFEQICHKRRRHIWIYEPDWFQCQMSNPDWFQCQLEYHEPIWIGFHTPTAMETHLHRDRSV